MSQIEIPDWVVEGACKNAWSEFRSGMETEIWEFADAARRDRLRQIVRAALRAAMEGWIAERGTTYYDNRDASLPTQVEWDSEPVAKVDVFTMRKEPAA